MMEMIYQSSAAADPHMWLMSTWNPASVTEGGIFNFI